MLCLLIDTSTWLDLGRRRDGQKFIRALDEFGSDGAVELLVPELVVDEFRRNRARVERSLSSSIAERLKSLGREIDQLTDDENDDAAKIVALAYHVPLVGQMTTKNFDDIEKLFHSALTIEPTDDDQRAVVQRGLDKKAPFHRAKNSTADALLVEMYSSRIATADLSADPHWFISSNTDDFSVASGDKRQPHTDIAALFSGPGSTYGVGSHAIEQALESYFGDALHDVLWQYDFKEDPRRLDEILAAETELFDRIWYHRSLQHDIRAEMDGDQEELERHREIAGPGRLRVEATYTDPGMLGPYTDFELGMLSGKLSALRWVLGSEWDFLDT